MKMNARVEWGRAPRGAISILALCFLSLPFTAKAASIGGTVLIGADPAEGGSFI